MLVNTFHKYTVYYYEWLYFALYLWEFLCKLSFLREIIFEFAT